MTLKFTPPKSKALPRYASYGADTMKTHTSMGAAKQSLANRCGPVYYSNNKWREGFILQLVDGEWYVRYHVKEGTSTEELPWFVDAWQYKGSSYWRSRYLSNEPTWDKDDYIKVRVSRPETKEEYAEWRIAVELERRGLSLDDDSRS